MRRASVVLATLVLATGCGPAPAVESPTLEPSEAASESAALDPADELAAIAWWETQSVGFGVIPEMPDPDPPVQPLMYRQLTIGTLDGRVTAVLALHGEWAHSSVAGPYGDAVLVANDSGMASEVFLISASDGSRTDLFETDAIVAAAAMGDGGRSIYYVELDRETLADDGLWRRPMDGGRAEQVVAEPFRDDFDGEVVSVYWITADPLVGRVVVQWCHGQVRCTSYLVATATGDVRERIEPGWPLGADTSTFFGDSLGSSRSAWAWNVGSDAIEAIPGAERSVPVRTSGGWRFVRDELEAPDGSTVLVDPEGHDEPIPGQDPPMTSIVTVSGDRGVVLPPGWVLRWPYHNIWWSAEDKFPESHGQLIEVETGQRVDLERPKLVITEDANCPVPVPGQMPSGRRVGAGVMELVDGRRTIRFGNGDDLVVVGIGWDAIDSSVSEEIAVRGRSGSAALVDGVGGSAPAFSWLEDTCDYIVWLPAATTLDAAVEYAARY